MPLFEATALLLNGSNEFRQSGKGQLAASFADSEQLNALRLSSHYHGLPNLEVRLSHSGEIFEEDEIIQRGVEECSLDEVPPKTQDQGQQPESEADA